MRLGNRTSPPGSIGHGLRCQHLGLQHGHYGPSTLTRFLNRHIGPSRPTGRAEGAGVFHRGLQPVADLAQVSPSIVKTIHQS